MPQVGITVFHTKCSVITLHVRVCVCVYMCVYIYSFCLFFYYFFYKKRILMPHIDFTFYVQTKGKL